MKINPFSLYIFLLFFSNTSYAQELEENSSISSSSGVNFLEAFLSASLIVQITFLILIIMS
ncbi:MAG: hypothetical protein OXC37_01915, partial [Bdellovibrionaceae bacterium]|nr:hypothetical protein [Pseudobdellovibrionaceae bacterium]